MATAQVKGQALAAGLVADESFFQRETGPFFRRIDWLSFWITTVVTFFSYFTMLAPTVTLEDCGELATGSDYLGVPHPPGYPSWTLVTWFFQRIFHWVHYFGQPDSNYMLVWKSLQELFGAGGAHTYPNPAWGVALASAFSGALACGILAMLVSRSGADMLRNIKRTTELLGIQGESVLCAVAGITSGLMLAFSPVMWSQAVIVEVYALNAFFQTLAVMLLYRWMSRPHENRTLWLMCFVFGFGITNHQTLLFLGPALALAVLLKNWRLALVFGLAAVLLGGVFFLNTAMLNHYEHISKLGLPLPDIQWALSKNPPPRALDLFGMHVPVVFFLYGGLAVAIPLLMLFLPYGRIVCPAFLLFYVGLSFNAFMAFASDQNPPINWGYPRIWQGFMHALTRGQYEAITVADVFTRRFLQQVGAYLMDLRGQYTLPIVVAGFLPFCAWSVTLNGRRYRALYIALALTVLAVPFIGLEVLQGEASALTTNWMEVVYKILISGIILLGIAGVGTLAAAWIRSFFVPAGPAAGTLFPGRLDWAFDISLELQKWMLTTIVAFLSLSVMFIAFQNLEMDLQTLFIGRVQFIQSHAIFALWIGYGLLFALAGIDTLLRGRKAATYLLAVGALLLPLILVWQNFYDEEQIKTVGGAEQNGHDFGWQFGAWGMEGVNVILKEISPAERQTYPNPQYPPPMSSNAIFFGGTDPGRFVPTYMIYCAKFRPDIFLITQNALADNTFMNVHRDLMGDSIWIPSQQDSNFAFQKYVQDVQAGKVAASADISFENGRVSVQGVGGVMLINGIIAQMMFEKNKATHPFYVEESYVIPWMYPYMEPNGLMLKMNNEPLPGLSPATVKNDREFWDWYAKRLLANPKFKRDVVARKTFSKLRSAIAGLYAYRRMMPESENAFRQAIDLYPLSPEANFRLADIYMQQRKFAAAKTLIETFLKEDPANTKVADFLKSIVGAGQMEERRKLLEGALSGNTPTLEQMMELAVVYRQLGQQGPFEALSRRIIEMPSAPPEAIMELAKIYGEMRRLDLIRFAFEKILQRDPENTQVWYEMAAVEANMNQPTNALAALEKAIRLGGPDVQKSARQDQRMDPVKNLPGFHRLVGSQPKAARSALENLY